MYHFKSSHIVQPMFKHFALSQFSESVLELRDQKKALDPLSLHIKTKIPESKGSGGKNKNPACCALRWTNQTFWRGASDSPLHAKKRNTHTHTKRHPQIEDSEKSPQRRGIVTHTSHTTFPHFVRGLSLWCEQQEFWPRSRVLWRSSRAVLNFVSLLWLLCDF